MDGRGFIRRYGRPESGRQNGRDGRPESGRKMGEMGYLDLKFKIMIDYGKQEIA